MKIGSDDRRAPSQQADPVVDRYDHCAGAQICGATGTRQQVTRDDLESGDRRLGSDELQPNLINLIKHTVDSWPRTFRLALLLTLVVVLFGALFWAVPLEVIIGPVSLTRLRFL